MHTKNATSNAGVAAEVSNIEQPKFVANLPVLPKGQKGFQEFHAAPLRPAHSGRAQAIADVHRLANVVKRQSEEKSAVLCMWICIIGA